MRSKTFARSVFVVAGVWGIAALAPLLFLVDLSGRRYAPPADYPHFFYGFVAVALAWQFAFFVIGSDPVRFRPFMVLAVIEKLGYVVIGTALGWLGRISTADAATAVPDFVLCVLFVVAFLKTGTVRE